MSASISEQKAYVESLSRKEVEDGLRKGHPIIAQYLFADRAKRMQQNDEAIAALEKAAGIPEPGQDIATKLADYLAQGAGQDAGQPGGQPGGQMPGMPGQGPGGPMPGIPRMPQGGGMAAGMPMNAAGGGLVPGYQEGGSYGDQYEEDFGFLDRPQSVAESFRQGTSPRMQDMPGYEHLFDEHGMPTFIGGAGFLRRAQAAAKPTIEVGKKLPEILQKFRIKNTPIVKKVQEQLDLFGGGSRKPSGFWRPPMQKLDLPDFIKRAPAASGGIMNMVKSVPSWMLRNKVATLTGAGGLAALLMPGGDETDPALTEDLLKMDIKNAPKPGAAYQSIRDQIEQFQIDATTPNANELAREKILRDQAKRYDKRIADLEGLQPTDEQAGLSREADLWKSVSDVFAGRSTGGDSRFSTIGDSLRAFDKERKTEQELFLEQVAGMEDSQAGIRAGLEGEIGQRLRAGEAYNQAILSTLEKDIAYDQAQKQKNVYSPEMVGKVTEWLESQKIGGEGYDPVMVQQVKDKLLRTWLGTGAADPAMIQALQAQGGLEGGGEDERGFWGSMGEAALKGPAAYLGGRFIPGLSRIPGAGPIAGLIGGGPAVYRGIKSLGDSDKLIG